MDGVLRAPPRPSWRGKREVSILVLMDGVLRGEKWGIDVLLLNKVSILVLMDGVLRDLNLNPMSIFSCVSILVLMDGVLRGPFKRSKRRCLLGFQSLF